MIQNNVLETCGRRFARVIADARPGDNVTASFAFCNVSADELRQWIDCGWITEICDPKQDPRIVYNGLAIEVSDD